MTDIERIHAWGHKNILCTHNSTIEITKDKNLSKKGNCIIGVNASKACNDLSTNLKTLINDEKKFKVILKVNDLQDYFYGFGNNKLRLLDKNNMVFRKSNFICDRTVLICCSKCSAEIDSNLIRSLRNPKAKLSVIFEINEY